MNWRKTIPKLLCFISFLVLLLSSINFDVYSQTSSNTITFENKSAEPALVKLIGPTNEVVTIPDAQNRTVNVSPGKYYILIRYGSIPNNYRYARGDPFTVTQTLTHYSAISITLHKVIGGDYNTKPIEAEEFEKTFNLNENRDVSISTESAKPKGEDYHNANDQWMRGEYTTSVEILKPLAEKGDQKSQALLGLAYSLGAGLERSRTKAEKWLQLAADQGDNEAAVFLGRSYLPPLMPEWSLDYSKATRWFRLAADRGDAEGQFRLGMLYRTGEGIAKDLVQAYSWLDLAASRGQIEAQKERELLDGELTQSQINEAIKLQQSLPQTAQINSTSGWDAFNKYDYKTALAIWRPLAEKGDAVAQLGLGTAYALGTGVTTSGWEAVMWLKPAAESGSDVAALLLAHIYTKGFLSTFPSAGYISIDYKEAAKWLQLAADRGSKTAQFQLGELYITGEGVPQDSVQAYMWLRLASEKGHDEAKKSCELLSKKMSLADINKAKQLQKNWKMKTNPKRPK